MVGDCGIRIGFSLRHSRLTFHFRRVPPQETQIEPAAKKLGNCNLALRSAPVHVLGFVEAVQELEGAAESHIGKRKLRIEPDRRFTLPDGFFIFAEKRINHSRQKAMGVYIPGVIPLPGLEGLLRLFHIARHLQIVIGGDEEPLGVGHAIPQLISLDDVFARQVILSDIRIGAAQKCIPEREFGVDLNSVLEKRDRSGRTGLIEGPGPRAVRIPGLERRRGGVHQRRRVLLYRRQRFPDLLAEPGGHAAERIQYFFTTGGLRLLFIQNLAIAAVLGPQPQHILAAQRVDAPFQHGGAGRAHANLLRQGGSQPSILRLRHQRQSPLNSLIGQQAENRRLLQLDRQPLPQGSVKYGVARGVDEIGQHQHVPLAEFRRGMQVPEASGGERGHDDKAGQ